ncbi:MAG TPA: YncE family protein, partial [Chthonomonadales bacterium]|nr:YncE family protein [Chthonomonadales bacterium]
MKGIVACILAMGSVVFAGPRAGVAAANYHVIRTFTVGGEGFWDYLTSDPSSHRLYISRGSHVMVVNENSGKVIGDIPGTTGVHGIALAPRHHKGFTSNGGDNTVSVFDTRTLKVIEKVPVGQGPDAIAYEPVTDRVFTFNGRGQDSTAVDAATDKVVGTVPLNGRPEFAVADGRGRIYNNIESTSEVAAIDAKSLSIVGRWSIAPGDGPSGISMDQNHRRVFSVCHNGLMTVLNADTGKIVATAPIGRGPDAAGFDPGEQLAISSNGEGNLTLVHEDSPDSYHVVQSVSTQVGARTMALDTRTHRIYVVTAQFGPPPAGAQGRFRRSMVPGSFVVLEVG